MKQKQYKITWAIDLEQEDVNSPEEAVNECWNRLHAHKNDWFWEVLDKDTGVTYEVDYDVVEGALPHRIVKD